MEINKQNQTAGDNSQQLQVGSIGSFTLINGITEQRAREIFSEMNAIARQNYTQDAYELAMKRVGMLEELLMNKVEQVDGMLEAFRDPSFQLLLVEAQKRAAASERESDFEMLTELLAYRVEKNNDRKTKASISKAVEIVDQIDDDALCGLTLVYAIESWVPTTGDISHGLSVLDGLFQSLCYRELPENFEWAYHLDILDAVRASSTDTFKNIEKYYTETLSGYVCVGINKESEVYQKAKAILMEASLPEALLVENELLNGYVRLDVRANNAIPDVLLLQRVDERFISRKVNDQEIQALNEVWNLYSKEKALLEQVKQSFIQKWDSYNSLREIRRWWDAIPHSFTITPIGRVLAHANAQRYNKKVPPIKRD